MHKKAYLNRVLGRMGAKERAMIQECNHLGKMPTPRDRKLFGSFVIGNKAELQAKMHANIERQNQWQQSFGSGQKIDDNNILNDQREFARVADSAIRQYQELSPTAMQEELQAALGKIQKAGVDQNEIGRLVSESPEGAMQAAILQAGQTGSADAEKMLENFQNYGWAESEFDLFDAVDMVMEDIVDLGSPELDVVQEQEAPNADHLLNMQAPDAPPTFAKIDGPVRRPDDFGTEMGHELEYPSLRLPSPGDAD